MADFQAPSDAEAQAPVVTSPEATAGDRSRRAALFIVFLVVFMFALLAALAWRASIRANQEKHTAQLALAASFVQDGAKLEDGANRNGRLPILRAACRALRIPWPQSAGFPICCSTGFGGCRARPCSIRDRSTPPRSVRTVAG